LQVRRNVLLCLCIVAIAWITRLAAAPGSEPVTHHFKIDSQPLGTALQQFAELSGVQIIFFSQVTEGLQAPALNGSYTVSGALEILLSGSQLIFRVINPKTIEICSPTAKDSGKCSIRPLGALRAAIDTGRHAILRPGSNRN
jgi:hypothetical protein